jgi:rubrerythrin
MNTAHWIRHFEQNTPLNDALPLPESPSGLPEAVRRPLAESLAVFQLGETGGGTRLRRHAAGLAREAGWAGYPRAVDRFIAEEQSHARLLARLVAHLGGRLRRKQWSNGLFRRVRGLAGLEFAIQMLLTAELVAEVYYGTLFLRCPDPAVRAVAGKILRDEVQHLAFQREFLAARLARLTPAAQRLWSWQFAAVHAFTAAAVAWDHRHCLRVLGVESAEFRRRATAARAAFVRRLERLLATPEAQACVS